MVGHCKSNKCKYGSYFKVYDDIKKRAGNIRALVTMFCISKKLPNVETFGTIAKEKYKSKVFRNLDKNSVGDENIQSEL